MHLKLKFIISFTILNENHRNKAQYVQHERIYQTHIIISWILRFEIQPELKSRDEFVVFWPCDVKTELPQCSSWWMEGSSKLNYARSCSKFKLPWMMLYVTVQDFARMWWFLASIFFRKACWWWINEESTLCSWRILQKNQEEKLREFCYFWI